MDTESSKVLSCMFCLTKLLRIYAMFISMLLLPLSGRAASIENLDFKGQLSTELLGAEIQSNWIKLADVRYMPDITYADRLSEKYTWDINVVGDFLLSYRDHATTEYANHAKIYRFNAQLKTSKSDLRIGLQQINFGPALILRSLKWFDQLDPTDPLKLSKGVRGLRYRYFFPDNSNLWFWMLYGNNEPKGYELVATKSGTPEVGGRVQIPLSMGEMGVSLHARRSQGPGFINEQVNNDLIEKRVAIDGRFDVEVGAWFEYVLVDQGGGSGVSLNWFSMNTIGMDYTFDVGNGVHLLLEHLTTSYSDEALNWGKRTQSSAMQVNYPLSILDSISVLSMSAWTQSYKFHYLQWNRTYDTWAFNIGLFIASDTYVVQNDPTFAGFSGKGVQFIVAYNH